MCFLLNLFFHHFFISFLVSVMLLKVRASEDRFFSLEMKNAGIKVETIFENNLSISNCLDNLMIIILIIFCFLSESSF